MASMFVRKETGCCVDPGLAELFLTETRSNSLCYISIRVLRPKELGLV